MITVRKSEERGHAQHGWLESYHTFSFSSYHDPRYMGFRDLRVINQDRVQPGEGFGTHGHRDMEIVSYVISGALEHKDSLGTGSVLRPGDVQRMSAGRGVTHSEFNHSKAEEVHFLQIWILPARQGIAPGYEEKRFGEDEKKNRLRVIVSPDSREGSLKIHQDATIYASILDPGTTLEHPLAPGRHAWVQLIQGELDLGGQVLRPGDGASVSQESLLRFQALKRAEFLLFDLA